MNNPTQSELAQIRKTALYSVSLSSKMEQTVVNEKLKELDSEMKRLIQNKNIYLKFS